MGDKIQKCPRKKCGNKATTSRTLGVLPCSNCQAKDGYAKFIRPDILHLGKSHRIQTQRDKHNGEGSLLQPYLGEGVNPEFFRRYPDQIEKYEAKEELERT